VLILFAGISCDNKEHNSASDKILRTNEGGDFRGVELGDDPEAVRAKETASSVHRMPDELVYRMNPTGEDSTWYEISYNFNQQGLYNINLEVFPVSDSVFQSIREEFISFYTEKYGECKYHEGYCQWRAISANGHIVSITISGAPSNRSRQCLKVNFNETEK
jgi:hypothetical protein